MSNNILTLSAIKAYSPKNTLTRTEDGYYKVVVGALNTFSRENIFYIKDTLEEQLNDKSSILVRRISNGQLFGERGHPTIPVNRSEEEQLKTMVTIHQDNISHHIKDIELKTTETPAPIPNKGNVIKVVATLAPAGVHAEEIRNSLDNPNINTAFSLRALHQMEYVNGIAMKKIFMFITWDWVIEPNMSPANKWESLTLDNLDISSITTTKLEDFIKRNNICLTTDSNNAIKELAEETLHYIKKGNNNTSLFSKW